MTKQHGKADQELACVQVFTDWLGSRRGVTYMVERADNIPGRRWDFVACEQGGGRWLGIEIKSLILADDRRQFNDWSAFLSRISNRFSSRIAGSWFVVAAMPWQFRQREANDLVEPLLEALAELDLGEGEMGNLGQGIAARFTRWPTKPPRHDPKLRAEQQVWKLVHPPEDLYVIKDSNRGSTIELGATVGQPFNVDWTQVEALLDIFEPDGQGQVKPNVQLDQARKEGASETALLLDCHVLWRPDVVRQALGTIDKSLMSAIDATYLIDIDGRRVERV